MVEKEKKAAEDNIENMDAGNSGFVSRIRANPWMLSTIFLAVVLVFLLFIRPTSLTGNVVSENIVEQNLLAFVESQGSGGAEIISTERNGSFYEITIDYNGQQFPVFVTADGNYLVPSLVPLTGNAVASDDSDSGSSGSASTQTNAPKSDKPKVELFVMALCPYGLQMEKGILPVANLLGDKIDFSVKFVSYIMHGKPEIDENTRQYCIQKDQSSKFNSYLGCYVEAGKTDECLTKAGIDKAKLDSCVAAADKQFGITAAYEDEGSWLSGRFPSYSVHKAENDQYSVQGSPTLVINGVQASSGRDAKSILSAVCNTFNTKPSECDDDLSSLGNPGPGFGFETQGGSAAAAGCVI